MIKTIKNTQGTSMGSYRVFKEDIYGTMCPITGWLYFAQAVKAAEEAKKGNSWARVLIQSADDADYADYVGEVV